MLSFVIVLRCRVGLILTQEIILDLGHKYEGVHLKSGEITSQWVAFPQALAVSELLHQAL